MGVKATSKRQITLFYQSKSRRAMQTLAYAKTEGLAIERINILKTPLTGTQIDELAYRLGIEIKDLENQEHPAFKKRFDYHDFSSEDWITMIKNHPELYQFLDEDPMTIPSVENPHMDKEVMQKYLVIYCKC